MFNPLKGLGEVNELRKQAMALQQALKQIVINEEKGTIEDVIEPFLIQQGFMLRTPRGRIATHQAYTHFGLKTPERILSTQNVSLFEALE